ncbi:unnamed protein product [Euphydryas editha]|uniref:Endonuclease-reverse transcriptase n=1 Tax=Euphydryas editha TaxID=104508 RepID=A0AAU9U543_EUPED|nr:unnamed protein product [Euphydryas editha]
MEKQMEILFEKFKEKLNEQTITLTTEITKNVMAALDEKIKILMEENSHLKVKVTNLEQKITFLEREKRRNNLVLFGVDEKGKTEIELVDSVKEIITESGIHLDSQEISQIHRIGKQSNKNRPVIISLTTTWKKHLILKNKRNFPTNVYVKEDFPKDVLEVRKQLQPQVEAERKNGNKAFIKYDKLIVKKQINDNREKRKREKTESPTTSSQKRLNAKNTENVNTSHNTKRDVIKPNILNYVARERSTSMTEMPKNM